MIMNNTEYLNRIEKFVDFVMKGIGLSNEPNPSFDVRWQNVCLVWWVIEILSSPDVYKMREETEFIFYKIFMERKS